MEEELQALREQLARQEEECFDLHATVATIQAEATHQVQQVQETTTQTVRSLQEQLRRAQHEANLARSQRKSQSTGASAIAPQQHVQQQQQQQRVTVSPENHTLVPGPTLALSIESARPTNTTLPVESSETTSLPEASVSTTVSTAFASGLDLARHLLQTNDPSPLYQTTRDHHPPPQAAANNTAATTIPTAIPNTNNSNTSSNNTNAITNDPIHRFLTSLTTAQPDYDITELQLVLLLVERCCAVDVVMAPSATEASTTTPVTSPDPATTVTTLVTQWNWLRRTLGYCSLDTRRALWWAMHTATTTQPSLPPQRRRRRTSSSIRIASRSHDHILSLSTVPRDTTTTITLVQQKLCHAFRKRLLTWTMPTSENSNYATAHTEMLWNALAVTCLQILHLLLSSDTVVVDRIGTDARNDDRDTELTISNTDNNSIDQAWMTEWVTSLTSVFQTNVDTWLQQTHPTAPRRFITHHTEDDTVEEKTAAKDTKTSTAASKWTPDATVMAWMAEALHVFCVAVLPNLDRLQSEVAPNQVRWERVWLATTLDLTQYVLLPQSELFWTAPITLEVAHLWIAFWDTVSDGPQLLRTLLATSASTHTKWHRGPSAIGLAVQFLHDIVVAQHLADHLATSVPIYVPWNALRDTWIRFVYAMLRFIEAQRTRSDSTATCLTLTAIVAERPDELKSALALLLTVDGYDDEDEEPKWTSACRVNVDIQALLQRVLDELDADENDLMDWAGMLDAYFPAPTPHDAAQTADGDNGGSHDKEDDDAMTNV
jgi:hypothetical protein